MIQDESETFKSLNSPKDKVGALSPFFRWDPDFNPQIKTEWSAKNVSGHLTFRHEGFARNIKYAPEGRKPIRGKLPEVSRSGAESNRDTSVKQLLKKLKQARITSCENFGNPSLNMIPCKKGSGDCPGPEHWDILPDHTGKHLAKLNKN